MDANQLKESIEAIDKVCEDRVFKEESKDEVIEEKPLDPPLTEEDNLLKDNTDSIDVVKKENEESSPPTNSEIKKDPELIIDDNVPSNEITVIKNEKDIDDSITSTKSTEEEKESEKLDSNPSTSHIENNILSSISVTEEEKQIVANNNESSESSSKTEKDKLSGEGNNTEDIINLLKTLSPEKLHEIKSKVLEITDKIETVVEEKDQEMSPPVESVIPIISETAESDNIQSTPKNDEVICLDSDDEEEQIIPSKKAKIDDESGNKIEMNGKNEKQLKECVNTNCPRSMDSEYIPCPSSILNMYYITRRPNKNYWICSKCSDDAFDIYEHLCSNITNNRPWFTVKIPKKQDLVEILDSDDEEEQTAKSRKKDSAACEDEMIIFDKETEAEVEDILKEFVKKFDIAKQISAENQHLEKKFIKNEFDLKVIDEELKKIERTSQKMYDEIYSINKPKYQRRPSLNLEVLRLHETAEIQNTASKLPSPSSSNISLNKATPDVPLQPTLRPMPNQVLARPSTQTTPEIQTSIQNVCYGIRQRGIQMPHWMPCKILEDISTTEGKKFKVQFCDNLPNSTAILNGREVSVSTVSEKLEIGARVIALFPRSHAKNRPPGVNALKRFLPGVIGEKLSQYNKRRYLVFCDYGQVKYCSPHEVREIAETSENVSDDVHPNLKLFIQDYLESRTNRSRALLNVRINTNIITERLGTWKKTVIQEIDCSLVKVFFIQDQTVEWIYRGSKRFYTIFQQTQKTNNSYQRRNDPGISYITIDDDEEKSSEKKDDDATSTNSEQAGSVEIKRNIAKKSTGRPPPQLSQLHLPSELSQQQDVQKVIILNDTTIYIEEPKKVAKIKHFTPKKGINAQQYKNHKCSPSCLPDLNNDLSNFSPLQKPLLTCWERQIVRQKNNRFVMYKAPCGRRLREMNEVFIYLNMTKCVLNVDNFDFDVSMQVLSSYIVEKDRCPLYLQDISDGKEGMKIPCINAFDDQKPPPLEYSSHRIPMQGVNINTDPEFMSCCDCTDNCVDKIKCACFQLTIKGAKYKDLLREDDENISYLWKKLLDPVKTGIYECNSRCHCSDRCLNKVVQQPIRIKMQLYRTKNRGWGLQSLHDIPKGTFVCNYTGQLYTEKEANSLCKGKDHGDEYFAELDLIENMERLKDNYESGVVYPESEEEKTSDSDSDYDDKKDNNDYDDGEFISRTANITSREICTRSSRTSSKTSSITSSKNGKKKASSSTPQRSNSEGSSDDEMVSMMPNTEEANMSNPFTRLPLRKLYGPKESVYIMDAKNSGNVGRYFNHSCNPNLYVQNVFVDTHDLRFPWISFFTNRAVKAGEELTWDYNYEPGTVPTKVLYCKCGAPNCRGRIL